MYLRSVLVGSALVVFFGKQQPSVLLGLSRPEIETSHFETYILHSESDILDSDLECNRKK